LILLVILDTTIADNYFKPLLQADLQQAGEIPFFIVR